MFTPFSMRDEDRINKNDLTKISLKFETVNEVNNRSSLRQKVLSKSSRDDCIQLSDKLYACNYEPCCSAACPRCFRCYRRWFYAEVCHLYEQYDEAYSLTIIYYDECLTSKELYKYDPKTLKDRLRQQLKRSGFKQPVIGCLEIDYHPEINRWLPHFHLLVLGDPIPVIALRRNFKKNIQVKGRTSKANRPVHVRIIKNKEKQLSYLCKSYWSRVEAYTNKQGKRQTRKVALKSKQLQLSLLVLDRMGYSGLLFLYGVRRRGSKLLKTAVSE
tara:strand:- start:3652 stop:4467 length:816 start_codon:yes stop_codon:yes gene_type:complete